MIAQSFNGMQVDVTDVATTALPREQWDYSQYRSPSRARRRRDMSKVVTREPACFQVGRRLVMHPRLWDALKKQTV